MNPLHQITGPIAERNVDMLTLNIQFGCWSAADTARAHADRATLLALMPWVRHEHDCDHVWMKRDPDDPKGMKSIPVGPCSCGLHATLQKLGAKV